MESMARKTKEIIRNTREVILQFPNPHRTGEAENMFKTAVKNENELNAMRKTLREERNVRISQGQQATPSSITAYGDILNNFERMGDYAMRITETILHMKAEEAQPDMKSLSGMPGPVSDQPLA